MQKSIFPEQTSNIVYELFGRYHESECMNSGSSRWDVVYGCHVQNFENFGNVDNFKSVESFLAGFYELLRLILRFLEISQVFATFCTVSQSF